MTQPSTTSTEPRRISPRELLERVVRLATDLRLQDLLTDGYQHHGEAFAAFIAGTEGLYVTPEVLINTFNNSYVTKAETLAGAYAEAFEALVSAERIDVPEVTVIDRDVTEFLRKYVEALRERVDDRFDFVEGIDHWFVFDSTKITPHLR